MNPPTVGQTLSPAQLSALGKPTILPSTANPTPVVEASASKYTPPAGVSIQDANLAPTPEVGATLTPTQLATMGTPKIITPDTGSLNPLVNIKDEVVAAAQQFEKGFGQSKSGAEDKNVVSGAEQIGEGALNEAGAGINVAFSPISGVLASIAHIPIGDSGDTVGSRIMKNGIQPIADAVSNWSALQKFMTANPNAAEVVGNLINIGATLGFAPEAKEPLVNAASTATDFIKNIPTKTAGMAENINPFNSTSDVSALTPDEINEKLQSVAKDWQSPTETTGPGQARFNNARAALEGDPNIPMNLAKNGFNPYTHIEDGVYQTADAADQIRTDNGKLERDILRPALQAADYTTPLTSVAEIVPKPDTSFGITPDDAETIQSKIDTKISALQRKYPDGMSLENKLDEKINYDKNGGYKPYKSNADNIDAIANRSIANSLRKNLIETTPQDIPIEAFQKEITSRYKMADYLDALHTKKAPVSFAMNLARLATKFGFAKLGSMFGGDVVSAFGGYQIGKMVEAFAENLSNPMRDEFLKSLKITNPEAFKTVSAYLDNIKKRAETSIKLPAASPKGSPENPIVVPVKEKSKVSVVPAKKSEPQRDPKTGRMKRVYSSDHNKT